MPSQLASHWGYTTVAVVFVTATSCEWSVNRGALAQAAGTTCRALCFEMRRAGPALLWQHVRPTPAWLQLLGPQRCPLRTHSAVASRPLPAPDGSKAWTWNRPQSCYCLTPGYHKAKRQLRRAVRPTSAVLAAAQPPVRQKLQEGREYVVHYVAAKKAWQLGGGGDVGGSSALSRCCIGVESM
jgi:hypothetical protein